MRMGEVNSAMMRGAIRGVRGLCAEITVVEVWVYLGINNISEFGDF